MKQITTLPKSGSLKKRVSAIPVAPPIEIQIWPIDKLVAYARNPRKNDAAVDRMCASIREFGFKIPCLVRSGGEVIDGHLRLKATWADWDDDLLALELQDLQASNLDLAMTGFDAKEIQLLQYRPPSISVRASWRKSTSSASDSTNSTRRVIE
jgi:hypothetical protein